MGHIKFSLLTGLQINLILVLNKIMFLFLSIDRILPLKILIMIWSKMRNKIKNSMNLWKKMSLLLRMYSIMLMNGLVSMNSMREKLLRPWRMNRMCILKMNIWISNSSRVRRIFKLKRKIAEVVLKRSRKFLMIVMYKKKNKCKIV